MLIVDSQVHIWAADRPDRPWPKPGSDGRNATPNLTVPLGYVRVLEEMTTAGVDAALLIPPSWEGDYNDLVLDAAASHPDKFAAMGRIATGDKAKAAAQLARWRMQPGMLGVRVLFEPGSEWTREGAEHWLWAAAESAGVPVTIASRAYFDVIERIAQRFPGLRISLDHLGADWSAHDAAAFARLTEVVDLARYPNVAVKASMLPALSTDRYPYRNVHGYVRAAYDAFGPRRLFWGSNLSRLTCPYRRAVTMFVEELAWLYGEDLELVMGKALCQWVGWDPVGSWNEVGRIARTGD